MQIALPAPSFMARWWRARPARPRVTRWFAAQVRHGATRALAPQPGRTIVHCRQGQAWITHDGDPKDVMLRPHESYAVERGGRMTLHALDGDCVLEIEVRG